MTIWFWSDPHFDHAKLATGLADSPRPFTTQAEMAQVLIERHNQFVKPSDHVYCLGDFCMNSKNVEQYAKQLHGHQRLILGNHEGQNIKDYLPWFKKILAFREFDGMMFTHAPIAPWSQRWRANVHGHCHKAKPLLYTAVNPDVDGHLKPSAYINISVENTGYRPVSLEEISAWSRRF